MNIFGKIIYPVCLFIGVCVYVFDYVRQCCGRVRVVVIGVAEEFYREEEGTFKKLHK